MKFIGVYNSYGQSGMREDILKAYEINQDNVIRQVKNLLKQ